uniref:Uncharacterized protein n=1 Tax=Ixodes ricinus TaxID=34613 RepID=A0A6B0UB66_IXORI
MYSYDTCFEISLLCLGDYNFSLLCILVLDGCFLCICMSEFLDRRCHVYQTMSFVLTRPFFCLVYCILCIVGQCVHSFALCNAFVYILNCR